jgi:hypothetical protein
MVNEKILLEFDHSIHVLCYQWFRLGNKFVVPDLDDLVNGALGSGLGATQYANYCKNNLMGAHYYYKEYKRKAETNKL